MSDLPYIGDELDLFALASHWKAYLRAQITPLLGPRVLEVGAGLGATTRSLCDGSSDSWLCLEPDARLAARLQSAIDSGSLPRCCSLRQGTTADLARAERFDSILYIDVLEHLADDAEEADRAARHLRPGGRLIVLSPAHQFLYTPFDARIGHVRRYSRATAARLRPPGLTTERLRYLDSVGMLASAGNKLLLRQSLPTRGQIRLWDSVMVPLSRFLDPLLAYRVGKSILAVFTRSLAPEPSPLDIRAAASASPAA